MSMQSLWNIYINKDLAKKPIHSLCGRKKPPLSRMCSYGVATISRLLELKGLFCKRALQKRPIFFKETYNFKEPTNRSHPILRLASGSVQHTQNEKKPVYQGGKKP